MAVTEMTFESSSENLVASGTGGSAGTAAIALSTEWANNGTKSLKFTVSASDTWYRCVRLNVSSPYNYRLRVYYMVPTSHFPSSSEALGLIAEEPWSIQSLFLYGDGSIWSGYTVNYNDIRTKNGYTQIVPAGTITSNTPFRLEMRQPNGNSGATVAIFADKDSTTPTASVEIGVFSNFDSTTKPILASSKINTTTGNTQATVVYIDNLAYEADGTYSTFIGPAASSGPINAALSLGNTSTLTVGNTFVSRSTSTTFSTTYNTTIAAPTLTKNASVSFLINQWWSSEAIGAFNWIASIYIYSNLTIGSSSVIPADLTYLIVPANNNYSTGYIEIPQDRVDWHVTIRITPETYQYQNMWALEVLLPKPLAPNVEHVLIVNYDRTGSSGRPPRVFLCINRALNPAGATFTGGWVVDLYGKVRVDGFVVEPAEVNNISATITYRWSVSDQRWWIDTWSGPVNLIDHRPNEMPEDMGPCYFSPQIRAHIAWPGIRDDHVAALKRLPYWVNRFMKENYFVSDILSWESNFESGHASLTNEGLGLRDTLNPAPYANANGTSNPPISMAKAWSKSFFGDNYSIDGRVILHELGHLFDFQGMAFAGHIYGYQPVGGSTILNGIGYRYWDEPTNTILREEFHANGEFYWTLTYASDGVTVNGYGEGRRGMNTINYEKPVNDMYALSGTIGMSDSNYYKTNIKEWVAQMLAIYFMRLDPTYNKEQWSNPTYDGQVSGSEQNYNNFVTYMIELGILPSLNAMLNYNTLTIGTPTVNKIASPAPMTTTSSLVANAIVRVKEVLRGWGIVRSGFKN